MGEHHAFGQPRGAATVGQHRHVLRGRSHGPRGGNGRGQQGGVAHTSGCVRNHVLKSGQK